MEKISKRTTPLRHLSNNLHNSPNFVSPLYIHRRPIISNNASDACSATPNKKHSSGLPYQNCWASDSDISIGSTKSKPTVRFSDENLTHYSDGKEIDFLHSSTTPMKSAMKKGMASVVPSGDLPAVTRNNKALSTPFGKNKSKGKAVVMPSSHSSVLKHATERAEATVVPSAYLTPQSRNKEKETRSILSREEIKDIGKSVAIFRNCQHENMEKEVASLRCPLLMTSTMRKRSNEINNTGQMKPWINPHPKKAKKRSIKQETDEYSLPRDYCEKQRAYFKEIDDFELLEEEVSYQELNK